MKTDKKIKIEYFTDVLCVWAYGAQIRMNELKKEFGARVEVVHRFIPLFAATGERIGRGWQDRGGYAGFNEHVREVAAEWSHVAVHPRLWLQDVPASSTPAHLFLKAVQLMDGCGELPKSNAAHGVFEAAVWRVRQAFFEQAQDVASRPVLESIGHSLELPLEAIWECVDNGQAHAALQLDIEAKEQRQVPGSPTLVLGEGRQRLYGNVGYRVIQANVRELLSDPRFGAASWC